MRRTNLVFLSLLFSFVACKSKDKQTPQSESNIDAARNFIRASLDGKFDEARTYMLQDSVNINCMDVAERKYQTTEQSIKDGYRTASISIISIKEPVKDSISMIVYANSFMKDPNTLKVIKANGEWLVDFKYLYLGMTDSLQPAPVTNDTIK